MCLEWRSRVCSRISVPNFHTSRVLPVYPPHLSSNVICNAASRFATSHSVNGARSLGEGLLFASQRTQGNGKVVSQYLVIPCLQVTIPPHIITIIVTIIYNGNNNNNNKNNECNIHLLSHIHTHTGDSPGLTVLLKDTLTRDLPDSGPEGSTLAFQVSHPPTDAWHSYTDPQVLLI